MKKISRIVGLAAMLIAIALTGCAPVTDSGEWKAPIASTTVKPEELNKTPLKAAALKDLLAGRWIYSSGGVTKSYTFTQDGKGWVVNGRTAPAGSSTSVRATVNDYELYDYEEFTYETDNGGGIILTVANPGSATDAVANKWKFDGTNFFDPNTSTGLPGVSTTNYATANTGIYDTKLKNKALHANGTIVRLNFNWKTKQINMDNSSEVYTFERRSAPREFEAVTDGFAIEYTYTEVQASDNRGGANTNITYTMSAPKTGRIVDLDRDIAALNSLIRRGYNIGEFELPVAFVPDPSGLRLMTVKVYNSKFGTVKDYENVVYSRIVGANDAFEGVKFTVNDQAYEVRRLSAVGTAGTAGYKAARWAIAWASTGTNVRPLPTDSAPTAFSAADFDWKGQNDRTQGEGKIKITSIEFEDVGPMFVFKLEDKYVGRVLIAGTNATTITGTLSVSTIRSTFVNANGNLIIGDNTISAYTPQYNIDKAWYNFFWYIDGSDVGTADSAANAVTIDRNALKTIVFNGKHTAQTAKLMFYGLKKDTDKKDTNSWNDGTAVTDATNVYAMNAGEHLFTATIKLEDYKDGVTYVDMLNNLKVPNPADVNVTVDAAATTNNDKYKTEVYRFKNWAADEAVIPGGATYTAANFQEELATAKPAPTAKFQSLATGSVSAVGQIPDGGTINFFAQYEQKGAIAMFYAIPATGTFAADETAYDNTVNVVKYEMTQASVGTALSPATMYQRAGGTTPPNITYSGRNYKFNGWSQIPTVESSGSVPAVGLAGDVLATGNGWNTPQIYYAAYVEAPAPVTVAATDLTITFAEVQYGDIPVTKVDDFKTKVAKIEYGTGASKADVTSLFNVTKVEVGTNDAYNGSVSSTNKVNVTVTLKDAAKEMYTFGNTAATPPAPITELKVEDQTVTVNAKKLTASMFTVAINSGLTTTTAPDADAFTKVMLTITSNVGKFVQGDGSEKDAADLIKATGGVTSADPNTGTANAYKKDTAGTYAITITLSALDDAGDSAFTGVAISDCYELDPASGLVYTALPVTIQ